MMGGGSSCQALCIIFEFLPETLAMLGLDFLPLRRCHLTLAVLGLLFSVAAAQAADPQAESNQNEKAIRATAVAFADAFNRGDAKAVAALWIENGSLAVEQGDVVRGRAP